MMLRLSVVTDNHNVNSCNTATVQFDWMESERDGEISCLSVVS